MNYTESFIYLFTLLDHCLKSLHNTVKHMNLLLLCKKLHNLFKIVHKLCKIVYKLCIFFTQLLVGSYVSQCCVKF